MLATRNNDGAPNTPDTSLGWEVTAGMEWKLLEKYRLRGTSGLLGAGEMVQLCVHRQKRAGLEYSNQDQLDYHHPQIIAPYGTNPDRTIDPIIGGEVALTVDF